MFRIVTKHKKLSAKAKCHLLNCDRATTLNQTHVILIFFHSENCYPHRLIGIQCSISEFPLEVLSAIALPSCFCEERKKDCLLLHGLMNVSVYLTTVKCREKP